LPLDRNPITRTAPAPIGWRVPLGIGVIVAVSLILTANILPSDVAFAILSTATFAAAGAAIVLADKELFNLRRMALPAVGLMSYTALIAVPAIFVFLGEIGSSRFRYLLAVHSALLTIPLGVVLAEFALGSSERGMSSSAAIPSWVRLTRLWDLMFLLALAIVALHVYRAGFIPIIHALSLRGDEMAMAMLREEAGNLLPGAVSQHLFFWNRILILPGLTLLAVGACLDGQKKRWLFRAVAAFCAAVFHGTFTLEKSFSMIPFIAIGGFLYLRAWRRIRSSYLLAILIAAASFPLLVYRWIIPESGLWMDVAFLLGKRLFNVPAQVTYAYFELVPGQMDFLYGKASTVMAYLTGNRFFDSANYIYRQDFPTGIESGSSNACFIGTAWANFGWPGVILEGVLAGVLLQFLWRLMMGREDAFSRTLHALLLVPFIVGFTSGPLETLFLTYAVAPAVAAWAILMRWFREPAASLAR